jgi:hypothetical protein
VKIGCQSAIAPEARIRVDLDAPHMLPGWAFRDGRDAPGSFLGRVRTKTPRRSAFIREQPPIGAVS